jgi:hypothetical protein
VTTTYFHREGYNCPSCQAGLLGSTGTDDVPPKPGDFSICAGCLSFLRYEQNGVRLCAESEAPNYALKKLRKYRKLLKQFKAGLPS